VLLAGGTNDHQPLYTVEELTAQLNGRSRRYLLTVPPFLDKAIEAVPISRPGGLRARRGRNATPFAELLRAYRQPPEVRIDPHADLARPGLLQRQTGLPKGVMLTHHNLVATLYQCQPVGHDRRRRRHRRVAVLHAYRLTVLMALTLWRGATLVTMPRFDLKQFLTLLQDYTGHRRGPGAADHAGAGRHPLVDRFDLSALRSVGSGAAPLRRAELQEACGRRLACMVFQGYGLPRARC
jgi:acyl-CoA synthetase (AMP-forming)/AMP-acid ligase II